MAAIQSFNISAISNTDKKVQRLINSKPMNKQKLALVLRSNLLIQRGYVKLGLNDLITLAQQTQQADLVKYAVAIAYKHDKKDTLIDLYSAWVELAPFSEEANLGLLGLIYNNPVIAKDNRSLLNTFVLRKLATKHPTHLALTWYRDNLKAQVSEITFTSSGVVHRLADNITANSTQPKSAIAKPNATKVINQPVNLVDPLILASADSELTPLTNSLSNNDLKSNQKTQTRHQVRTVNTSNFKIKNGRINQPKKSPSTTPPNLSILSFSSK